ncbi:hypothetical protein PS898_05433 [Pseudomonas fluorescens]|nr:hypothetical protein PS898_05433 [Pseudomonas fluorescens]
MAGDHQFYPGIQRRRDIGNVVHQEGVPTVQVETQAVGEIVCPGGVQVIVPAYYVQRGNRCQLLEDLDCSDVAGVNDPLATLQGSQVFGAEQAVGIGDHANFHAPLPGRLMNVNTGYPSQRAQVATQKPGGHFTRRFSLEGR